MNDDVIVEHEALVDDPDDPTDDQLVDAIEDLCVNSILNFIEEQDYLLDLELY